MPSTTTRSPRRSPVNKPAFQEPEALIEAPAAVEPGRPADHNGVPVQREELQHNLPNAAPFKISKLHLANGEVAFACRDCTFTGDTRADVQHHRNQMHGTRYGKKTPRVIFEKDKDGPELILPPRGDQPAPSNPMQLTLGEILSLAPTFAAYFDLIDRLEAERDAAYEEARANHIDRATQHKIDVYETHRAEILDLRLAVQKHANYEQIRTELYELRAWKRAVMKKLGAVGFVLSEEEQ